MKHFNIGEKLYIFSKKQITPLQIKFIYDLGQTTSSKNIIHHSRFLHEELSIRLAQRVYNLYNLPYGLPLVNEIKEVINLYSISFDKIQSTPIPICSASVEDLTYVIKDIKKDHNLLEEIIGDGFQNISNPFIDYELINHEMNNFFMSRIGIRTLISQHIEKVLCDNSIIVDCSVHTIMEDAIKEVRNMAKSAHIEVPARISLTNNSKNTIHYIPAHLFYIFIEVLKNSIVAHSSVNEINEPIKISINEGPQDFIIKVSDRGGGFPFKDIKKSLSYSYSTSPKIGSIANNRGPIMSGLGFGLPLAKQYCMYFGGDLNISPIEGYGTDVHIYIHKLGTQTEQI